MSKSAGSIQYSTLVWIDSRGAEGKQPAEAAARSVPRKRRAEADCRGPEGCSLQREGEGEGQREAGPPEG